MGTSSIARSSLWRGERFCYFCRHVAVTFTATDGDPESAHMTARNTSSLINEQYARNFLCCRAYCKWPVHDGIVSDKVWSMKGTFPLRPLRLNWLIKLVNQIHHTALGKKCNTLLALRVPGQKTRIFLGASCRMFSLLSYVLCHSCNWAKQVQIL